MIGPIVCDIEGLELTPAERKRLLNPLVGMVILFTRNYESREQLHRLCDAIHAVKPGLLIGVDHEGGRVQRFREAFTAIPAMHAYGDLYAKDAARALKALKAATFVLAAELRDCGVDFTFAPVLDLDWQKSAIIGERSFASDPEAVATLARAACEGLAQAGMANCGKHFPGHGFAVADSHVTLPVDERSADEILAKDVKPYRALTDILTSVMTAHVLYPALDAVPASFSHTIAADILRGKVGFNGLLFSDDLSMGGAKTEGTILERAQKALAAGCDALIVCNDPDATEELLSKLTWKKPPLFATRALRLVPVAGPWKFVNLRDNCAYRHCLECMTDGL